MARAALAATLAASYGIYGPAYELLEHAARARRRRSTSTPRSTSAACWDLARADSLADFIARAEPRRAATTRRCSATTRCASSPVDNEQLIAYAKSHAGRCDNVIVCVVNLDPHHTQSGWLELDLAAFGLRADQPYQMHDLITDAHFLWHGRAQLRDASTRSACRRT